MKILLVLILLYSIGNFHISESTALFNFLPETKLRIDAKGNFISEALDKIRNKETDLSYEDFESLLKLTFNQFKGFKLKFNKTYNSNDEEFERMIQFTKKKLQIHHHNKKFYSGNATFYMDINYMSDWNETEKRHLTGFRVNLQNNVKNTTRDSSTYLTPSIELRIPDFMDWRQRGAVAPVESQGICGSCYSFSAIGALETQIWRKTGRLVQLSEQQIVDCDSGNGGCHGGTMISVFNYIRRVGGVDTDADYPYVSGHTHHRNKHCRYSTHFRSTGDTYIKVTGSVQITSRNEEQMREAVSMIGPISVAIYSPEELEAYQGGIFDDVFCGRGEKPLNHAVLIVGYGRDILMDMPYWIVKNSWGQHWGEEGFFRLRRGVNACGIANVPIYPLV